MKIIHTEFLRFFDSFVFYIDTLHYHDDNVKVYLGTHVPMQDKPYILYNAEQLTRQDALQLLLNDIKRTLPLEVWDFSIANIKILKEHGINAIFKPLISPMSYVNRLRTWRSVDTTSDVSYDVGFCGTNSSRREVILSQLRNRGLSVLNIGNNRAEEIYGETRDKLLAKCKVHINIHYATDYNVFESARCEPWLQAGVPIISEPSLDDDNRCIIANYGDDFVNMVCKVVNSITRYNNVNGYTLYTFDASPAGAC
jgi:hypothetical protein